MSIEKKLYWEDFVPGSRESMGLVTVDLNEVLEFASRYDPQPFHISEERLSIRSMAGLLRAAGILVPWSCGLCATHTC